MLYGLPPFYNTNINVMYESILKDELKFPGLISLDSDTKSFIKSLLDKNQKSRLGSGSNGIKDVMDHPFFSSINWEKLYNKNIDPPFKPDNNEKNIKCAKNFDKMFTAETIPKLKIDPPKDTYESNYEKFYYEYNPFHQLFDMNKFDKMEKFNNVTFKFTYN